MLVRLFTDLLFVGHRFTLAFACTGIGTGALAAQREAFAVAEAPVASDVHQALDVGLDFPAQRTFDLEVIVDDTTYVANVFLGPIFHTDVFADSRFRENADRSRTANAEDVGETDYAPLVLGKVNASNTCHIMNSVLEYGELSLALFETRIFLVDDVQLSVATHNLAVGGTLFNGGSDFHDKKV
jgi:hypothetical protein